ncbi:hypothetical protein BJX62DRAFT_204503 [Aspergillus germanicus]
MRLMRLFRCGIAVRIQIHWATAWAMGCIEHVAYSTPYVCMLGYVGLDPGRLNLLHCQLHTITVGDHLMHGPT